MVAVVQRHRQHRLHPLRLLVLNFGYFHMTFKEMNLLTVKHFKITNGQPHQPLMYDLNFKNGCFRESCLDRSHELEEDFLVRVTPPDALVQDVVKLSDVELIQVAKVRASYLIRLKKNLILLHFLKKILISFLFVMTALALYLSGYKAIGIGMFSAGHLYVGIKVLILDGYESYRNKEIDRRQWIINLVSGLSYIAFGLLIFIMFL